jgi:hypothetical protein
MSFVCFLREFPHPTEEADSNRARRQSLSLHGLSEHRAGRPCGGRALAHGKNRNVEVHRGASAAA